MILPQPLLRGTLVRRYNRFMADVVLDSAITVTAHCPNSGSMLSVNTPGSEVWLSPATDPNRKLKYTWELIRVGEALVGINTHRANGIVAEALSRGAIAELCGYTDMRREVRYGSKSRIDLLLQSPNCPNCYVEVKNVTLKRTLADGSLAEFPDAVTARGTKHLVELAEVVKRGERAVMMYLLQRSDSDTFAIAADIDPMYAAALAQAKAVGVEVLAYRCCVTTTTITITDRVRAVLP